MAGTVYSLHFCGADLEKHVSAEVLVKKQHRVEIERGVVRRIDQVQVQMLDEVHFQI